MGINCKKEKKREIMKDNFYPVNRRILSLFLAVLLILCGGCGIEKTDGSKISDLAYEMVEEENIPEELKAKIEEKKAADFKLTYESDGCIYVVRGYGEQETGGYSIQVLEFYQTLNTVVLHTNLVGPSRDELKNTAPSYPYVVLRTQNPEKNVVFE